MTIEQAKEILKTVPANKKELDEYKKALVLVSNHHLKPRSNP